MFDKLRKVLNAANVKFIGIGDKPVRSPYGEYYQTPSPFNNFGEQVIYFATSGSSGYMRNGVYRDISGAKILEGEYIEVVSQSGLTALMSPGTLEKMWNGDKFDLVTGEELK